MLVSASQNRQAPYWAETPGPNSHSPVPMLVPASTTPGPIRTSVSVKGISRGPSSPSTVPRVLAG